MNDSPESEIIVPVEGHTEHSNPLRAVVITTKRINIKPPVTLNIMLAQRLGQSVRSELHYGECIREIGPRGGIKDYITRYRVAGQMRMWKRDEKRYRIPLKHGMYGRGSELTQDNEHMFHLAEDCPLALIDEHARLEEEALKACNEVRKHEMDHTLEGSHPWISVSECVKCYAEICINARPEPNNVKIGGRAIAVECTYAKEGHDDIRVEHDNG